MDCNSTHKQELSEDSVIEVLVCLKMSLQARIVLSLNETMAVEMKESTRLVQVWTSKLLHFYIIMQSRATTNNIPRAQYTSALQNKRSFIGLCPWHLKSTWLHIQLQLHIFQQRLVLKEEKRIFATSTSIGIVLLLSSFCSITAQIMHIQCRISHKRKLPNWHHWT